MASLAEIRARLQAAENKQGGQSATSSDIYPHWNIDENTTATVRFLPDANDKNTFFWVERQLIKLPFNGVKGEQTVNLDEQIEYLHRGIGGRNFTRTWTLADHVEVTGAGIANGILTIALERQVPEEQKPKKIAISYTR